MTWQIAIAANAIIGIAYFSIATAIVVPLARSNQLRSNPLGGATAAIFFTCAVMHASHALHMLVPEFVADEQGLAMRASWSWPLAVWDVVSALVAVYYWTLRRNYGALMQGAALFEDLRKREQQALELNDSVLQGLVVSKMALDLDDTAKAQAALDQSIASASRIITNLLGSEHFSIELLRSAPAVVDLDASTRAGTPAGRPPGHPTGHSTSPPEENPS
jgi:hypothetical protein